MSQPHTIEAALAHHVAFAVELGCTDYTNRLGIQKMPPGYALLLNADETHFFWMRHDDTQSSIDWNKWRVRRSAIAHAKNHP